MEQKQHIQQLLHKYLQDTASEEEIQALLTALEQSPDNKAWENLLLPVFEKQQAIPGYQAADWEPVIQHILSPKEKALPAKVRRIPVFARMAAAAAVIAAAGIGGYLFYTGKTQHNTLTHTQDRAPVSNRAMLTLADGRSIPLDSAATGLLATQGNASIAKGAGDALTYTTGKVPANGPIQYNTLSTPRGGQFQLVLPDGSKVWLNAASSIRYPVNFAANERKVQLKGEAYFEVAANTTAPFKVQSAQQQVDVLGTSFNINAYEEEGFTRTTLLTGRVKVASGSDYVLAPGQQLQVQTSGASLNEHANVEQAIAWKNGQLDMNNLDIKALMRHIARWYDVDVVYEGSLPEKHFGGLLDHKVYLSNIIEVLESQGIRCRLEGKQLHVSAK